eukprot:CAMPEP_0170183882 /NCGR_PEP_ID=MMETSP0040_2-20121228/32055_1 /TAXON_ID=641309 /ORGANISM="Lotharella oceanica, Strain CCMP622" /LENGTH=98 /DNA_ID=CAMNT_0010429753 /DNA_START=543 /DNA_END=835 /DNA_ORIENTATION=-
MITAFFWPSGASLVILRKWAISSGISHTSRPFFPIALVPSAMATTRPKLSSEADAPPYSPPVVIPLLTIPDILRTWQLLRGLRARPKASTLPNVARRG